jgi:hypothetical protein
MVLEFLLQLGKDKLTGFCRRAVLFPAAAAFSLDCQRGLQLISSCRFLRRKGLGKNKLCSPYVFGCLYVCEHQPTYDWRIFDRTETIDF